MGIPEARKWQRNFFCHSESDFSGLYFIVVLQYNVQIAIIICSLGIYLLYFKNDSALNLITFYILKNFSTQNENVRYVL